MITSVEQACRKRQTVTGCRKTAGKETSECAQYNWHGLSMPSGLFHCNLSHLCQRNILVNSS